MIESFFKGQHRKPLASVTRKSKESMGNEWLRYQPKRYSEVQGKSGGTA